jgi:predicted RNA-binding protein Jag
MAGDNFPLGEPPGVRLIAQMRVNIARHRQLPERLAQRIALRRQRRVVEVGSTTALRLIDPMPRRQREVVHEGAAPVSPLTSPISSSSR